MTRNLAADRASAWALDAPFLIAGAGIGGLAAAIALADIGFRVEVLEQRAETSEDGAGIQIGPNGVHALRQLGVSDRLQPLVGRPEAIAVMQGLTGRCLTRLPLMPAMEMQHGAPYWVARRADLHQALLSRARSFPAIEIRHGFKVAALEETSSGVRVRASSGVPAEGAALIGADGIWSTVARLALHTPAPRFSGRTAARVVMPADDLPRPFREAITGLWLGPKTHLVHYPVAAGRQVNFVAIIEGGEETQEWGTPLEPAELLAKFDGWADGVRALFRRPAPWRRWSLMGRPDLPALSAGRVALMGDAAHPMLPFLAQGAVLALEDAVTLAAAIRSSPHDIETALRTYSDQRIERARRVVAASRRNGRIYHLSGLAATARDATLTWLPPGRLIAGYDWLYGHRCPDI